MSSASQESVEKVDAGFATVHGIDVSLFQGAIDWQKVATQATVQGEQIQFTYIKATEGGTIVDPRFAANWRNAQGLLPRGAYHFFHATNTPDDIKPQADNFIHTLQAALAGTGEASPELPPMVDIESMPKDVTADQAVSALQRFVDLVEQAFGKRPIIYTGPFFWQQFMGNSNVFAEDYLLWIASYGAQHSDDQGFDAPARDPLIPGGWPGFCIWQNAVQQGVAGIQGLVDRNIVRLPAGVTIVDFLNRAPGRPLLGHDELKTVLLQQAGAQELIQLMPGERLFTQMLADGFAPNSPEFTLDFSGTSYQIQRAERLDSGDVRVYFAPAAGAEPPQFVTRPAGGAPPAAGQAASLADALAAAADARQALRFNRDAGLQKALCADGYLPTSGEFSLQFQSASYAAQCAEHPVTSQKRVYYVQAPDWANVWFFDNP